MSEIGGPRPPLGDEKPASIMLIEDDGAVQQAMRLLLGRLGHHVTVADSGEAALRLFAEGADVQVAILDLNMPGMGGAAALRAIRQIRPSLPVVISTGFVDFDARALANTYAGVLLLQKPFALSELRQVLSTALACIGMPGLSDAQR